MNITEDYITKANPKEEKQDSKMEDIKVLYLNGFEINDFILKSLITNKIEFLSLQNNNLRNLNFIKKLNNLWYLDIRRNPIEDFSAFETKKKFGFLGISIEKISEKAISEVKNLLVGIIYLKIDNKNIENKFISQNPNIFRKNQEFNSDFILGDKNFYKKNANNNANNIKDFLDFEFNANNNNNNNEDLPYIEIEKIFSKNKFLALKYFMKKVAKIKNNILQIMINKETNNNNNILDIESIKKKELHLIENENLKSSLLEIEKLNLIFYKKLLESFINLHKNKKEIFNSDYKNYFTNPITSILSNKTIEEKNFYYDLNFLRSPDLLKQLAFITIIPLHFLEILTKENSSNLLIFLLNYNKNNKRNELNNLQLDISRFFELDFFLKFGIFFDLINKLKRYFSITKSQNKSEEFFPKENSKGKTFLNEEKFEEILNFLDNISLLGKLKTLQEKKYFFNKENFPLEKKNIFEFLLKNDHNLITEVFIIIQILIEILMTLKFKNFEFFVEVEKFVFDFFISSEDKVITSKNNENLFFNVFDFLFSNKKINLDQKNREILFEQIKEMKLLNFFDVNSKLYMSDINTNVNANVNVNNDIVTRNNFNSENIIDKNKSGTEIYNGKNYDKKFRTFEKNRILKHIYEADEMDKEKEKENNKNKVKTCKSDFFINYNSDKKDKNINTDFNNFNNEIKINFNNNINYTNYNLSADCKIYVNKLNPEKINEIYSQEKINKRIVLSRISNIKSNRLSLDLQNNTTEDYFNNNDNSTEDENTKLKILTNYNNFSTPLNKAKKTSPKVVSNKKEKRKNDSKNELKINFSEIEFNCNNKTREKSVKSPVNVNTNTPFKSISKECLNVQNKLSMSLTHKKIIPVRKISPIKIKEKEQKEIEENVKIQKINYNLKKEFPGFETTENENNDTNENDHFIVSNKNNFKLPKILNNTDINLNLNLNSMKNISTNNKGNLLNKKGKNNLNRNYTFNNNKNNNNNNNDNNNTFDTINLNNTIILNKSNNNSFINNNNNNKNYINDNIENIVNINLNTSKEEYENLRESTVNNINNFTNKKKQNFITRTEYLDQLEKRKQFISLNNNIKENEAINNTKEISSFLNEKNSKKNPRKNAEKNNFDINKFDEKFEYTNLNSQKNMISMDFNFRSTQLSLLNNYLKEIKSENYMQKTSTKFDFNFNKIAMNTTKFFNQNKNNFKNLEKIKNFEINNKNFVSKYDENVRRNINNNNKTNETNENSSVNVKSEKNEMGTNTIPNIEVLVDGKNKQNFTEKKKNVNNYNSEKIGDKKKEFINFNANIKRIVHHWNKNNVKQKSIEKDEIRINEFEKIQRRNKMRFLMLKK